MASNRSITVTLRANVQDFKSQFDAATRAAESTAKATEQSAKQAETAMGRMVQSAKTNQAAWTTAGTTLTAFGAATLGGLGLATKAAMDWESAWAGVKKTVDGTPEQMQSLEDGLRGLARELPASHQEIAAVAEAAGQLGVARDDILSFTRTMINLGEATNLSADEAATSIAQFTNVMGTASDDVSRLGSTLVALGNDGASTERDIMMMAQRLSGAGALIGASEADILALSAALSDVGISAEAGGGSLSRVLHKINTDVIDNGDGLEAWAEVAGMSAESFAQTWRTSPVEALQAFMVGLDGVKTSGGNAVQTLKDLGIRSSEETRALLSMSGAGELLGKHLDNANASWAENTALVAEASQRYETAESRIAMARNAIVDAGISIGGVLLPVLADAADGIADLAGWFADLPAPVHATIGGLAGVAGAASLGAGAFLLITPRVLDTVSAFRDLGAISPGTASKVGRTTLAIGKVGLAVGVAAAAFPLLVTAGREIEDALRGVDDATRNLGMNELTSKLMDAAASGDAFTAVMGDMFDSGAINTTQFENLGEAVQKVSGLDTDMFARTGKSLGLTTGYLRDAEERFDGLGEAITLMAQTDLPTAQEAFAAFATEAQAGGASIEEIFRVLPGARDAFAGVALEMGLATDDATLFKIATGELSPVVDEATGATVGLEGAMGDLAETTETAADAAENYLESLSTMAGLFIDAERAAMDYKDSLEETAKAAGENGKHWEDGTEAADENKRALLDLADQALATAEAFASENKSGTFLQQAREDLIDVATEMTGSKELAEEYVNQLLGTPEEITTLVEFEAQAAKDEWTQLWDEMGTHPPLAIDADTTPAAESMMEFQGTVMNGAPPEVPIGADTTAATEEIHIWGSQVGDMPTTPIAIDADPSGAILGADEAKVALDSIPHVTRTESGLDIGPLITQADQAYLELAYLESQKPTPTADLNDAELIGVAGAAVTRLNEIDGMTPTPELQAEASVLRRVVSESQGRINGMTGKEVDVTAHAQGFSGVSNLRNEISRLQSKWVTVGVKYQTSGSPVRGTPVPQLARAGGGPIYGPGTGTSDSVPVAASNGEHMLTAREVSLAGGHQSVYRLRQQLLMGAKTLHLATGGGIENGSVAPVRALVPAGSMPGARAGVVIESLTVQPQVMAEMDPSVFGRRFGESFSETVRGIRFDV